MKILFLSRLYWPHVGGVERHVEEIAKRLKLKAISIKILTTRYDKSLKTREKRNGMEIIRFEQPKIKFLGLLYTWLWMLRNIDLIYKSDRIHTNDVFIWYLPFRFLFPRKPVFTTFHGRWGKYPIPLVDVIQKRLGAKLSNGVISIGEYIPKNYGFKSDITLYGAVNIIQNSKISKAWPFGLKIKNDNSKSKIIYVGRLDEDTGLPIFLNSLKRCRRTDDRSEVNIGFCGDGKMRKECEKFGKVYGFTDPTPFYRKAKFCFASGYLTIHEAMAHKCLVFAAYKHPLHRDYYKLTPFSKFIFISDNPQKIAERIKYLNKNQKAAQKIIEEGYNWVKGETWEKLTNSYIKLWERKIT